MSKPSSEPRAPMPWIVEFTTGHVVGLVIVVGTAIWCQRFPAFVSIPCSIISLVISYLLLTDAIRRKSRHKSKSTTSFGTSKTRPRRLPLNRVRGMPKRSNHSITIYPTKDE